MKYENSLDFIIKSIFIIYVMNETNVLYNYI